MTKKKRSHSRSTSPHTNAPMQRTPAGIMQRTTKVVTNAATTAARQLMSSGSKAMRWNKNQGLDAMVQQGDVSATAIAPSASTPNNNNLGANTTQEYGVMDSNASMLLDLGSRAPRFMTNTASQSSPIRGGQTTTHVSGATPPISQATAPTPSTNPPTSQATAPTPSVIPPGINPSTPPRLNMSGISGVTEVRTDLLDDQAASMSVTGSYIPSPSPRQNTQSPDTHQLQQTLRNSASEMVCTHSSSSDSGGRANTFATALASNTSAVVETVQEGESDDDGEWPEVNLTPRLLNTYNDPNSTYDSGLQELVIDTVDPGCANFAMNVGALGNSSGTPMDGAQNMSFGESTVNGGDTVDGNGGNEGVASSHNFDPSDPVVMAALLTQPPVADPRSPTMIRFDEQVTVTNYLPDHSPNALQTLGTAASTLTGNLGGASAAGSTQGNPTLLQGNPSQGNPASQPSGNTNTNGNPNSNNSSGSGSNQGGSSTNNDPPDPGPVANYLDKLMFAYSTMGGPLENWGIESMIKVADVVRFTPNPTVQSPHQLELSSVRLLVRPDIVDPATDRVYFNN